ncbi:MAG TPA: hypothetical protein VFE62_00930, partial [Gemmataceae bacterium]|nr:hypothetical protein [Gemmataceae bacterium]
MIRFEPQSVASALLVTLFVNVFACAGEGEANHSFRVTIASRLTVEAMGKSQLIEADTDFNYTWKQRERERTLIVDLIAVKGVFDGKETMNTTMSRAKLVTLEGGQKREILFEDAPEPLKAMLRDTFQSPICKIKVDERGREIKREIVSNAGAKDLQKQGIIENARMFHPPYMSDKDEWSAVTEISMGNGGFAKGQLAYKKVPGGKNGQKVIVSGTLTNEGFDFPDQPIRIRKVKYIVRGEQTFDATRGHWTSGKLKIEASFEMASGEKQPVATAKGTILLTHQELLVKK